MGLMRDAPILMHGTSYFDVLQAPFILSANQLIDQPRDVQSHSSHAKRWWGLLRNCLAALNLSRSRLIVPSKAGLPSM